MTRKVDFGSASEGYVYQDLLTVFFLLEHMINHADQEWSFQIDKKDSSEDFFDDITIRLNGNIKKIQIKYSNATVNKRLEKQNLASGKNINLAIDQLFSAWKNYQEHNITLRLCLAWNEPVDSLISFLCKTEETGHFCEFNHNTILYRLNIDTLWPVNQQVHCSWKRLRKAIKTQDRNDFLQFCNVFTIEVNCPKFSLDLQNKGQLEQIVEQQLQRLGINSYPNNHLSIEEAILKLARLVQYNRSDPNATKITEQTIIDSLNIKKDYGAIPQNFPINEDKKIILSQYNINNVIEKIKTHKRVLMTGAPGSGKSWFINDLKRELEKQEILTIYHYCYTDLSDQYINDRIKIDSLYGNLISNFLKLEPNLKSEKEETYASNLTELNILIRTTSKKIVIIIDGLDHIERIYANATHISIDQINIISEINKIETNNNVCIFLVSQPIEQVCSLNNLDQIEIPKWDIEDVKQLMNKHNLQDTQDNDQNLSSLLYQKSEGNPLYLTYMMRNLEDHTQNPFNIINDLPVYNKNLNDYYQHLWKKLKENSQQDPIYALCAVHIGLTEDELVGITGIGDFVRNSLDYFRCVLTERTIYNVEGAESSYEYSLYHESFKRFIIDYLKHSNFNLQKKLFQPVLNWFKEINFYEHVKPYQCLLELLIKCEQYQDIIQYTTTDFVHKSVKHGHPWSVIKQNYEWLVVAVTHLNRIDKILLLDQLRNILNQAEYEYNEVFEQYIEAFYLKNGWKETGYRLFLNFDQHPYGLLNGLKFCYVANNNRIKAPWGFYAYEYFRNHSESKEHFKYYCRELLVQNDCKEIERLVNFINQNKDTIAEHVLKQELTYFIKIRPDNAYLDQVLNKLNDIEKQSSQTLDSLVDSLLNYKGHPRESLVDLVSNFCKQIKLSIEQNIDIEKYINDFKLQDTIFFNWLIYFIRIKQLSFNENNDSKRIIEEFKTLILSEEPFKGNPRVVDLYEIKELILFSLQEGLSLAFNYISDKEDYIELLNILKKAHQLFRFIETNLTFFFKSLSENLTHSNAQIIADILEETYQENKLHVPYTSLSRYCFSLVKVYAFIENKEKVDFYYSQGVMYSLAYGYHKDFTLQNLTCSILSFYKTNPNEDETYLLSLKNLISTAVNHSDGDELHYLHDDWYEQFYDLNQQKALYYAITELKKVYNDQHIEFFLAHILSDLRTDINPVTKAFLYQTFFGDTFNDFFIASFKTTLQLSDKDNVVKDCLIASNYSNLINRSKESFRNTEDLKASYKEYIETLQIEQKIELKEETESKNEFIGNPNRIDYAAIHQMNDNQLALYLGKHPIFEDDIEIIKLLFQGWQDLSVEKKNIIKSIVEFNKYNGFIEKNIYLKKLFQQNNDILSYYYIVCFFYTFDGNYKLFTNTHFLTSALKLNPLKTKEHFTELLFDSLSSYNDNFSHLGSLFNTLCNIKAFKQEDLSLAWKGMYEVIEARLPEQEKYCFEHLSVDYTGMTDDELYVCLLITRFKSGGTLRCHITLSGLAILLFEKPILCIKPLKWFLTHTQDFENLILLIILELILVYNKEKDDSYIFNFEEELKDIYPTNYFLIDYIIEAVFALPSNISNVKSDISESVPNQYANDFLQYINYRYKRLFENKFDLSIIFEKGKEKLKDKTKIYRNATFGIYGNIYRTDCFLTEANMQFYNKLKNLVSYEDQNLYNDLRIDIEAIIAQYLSLSIRSTELKRYYDYEQQECISLNIIPKQGWVRIAHIEYEFVEEDYQQKSAVLIHKGQVIFQLNESEEKKEIVIFPNKNDYSFEFFKLLHLKIAILKELELTFCHFLKGYSLTNNQNEIIVKYNAWYSNFADRYHSDNVGIPQLNGAELLIREDYYRKLCDKYQDNGIYQIKCE